MIIYTFIFIVIFILCITEEYTPINRKKYINIFMLLFLCLFSGFRNLGGSDFDIYKIVYENVPSFSNAILNWDTILEEDNLYNMEKGYIIYLSFLKTFLNLSFYGYLVIQSFIIYSLMYFGLKKYTNHWGIFMILFLYKMFIYETFISMRQPLTIVLFYLILHLIYEGRVFKYLLILLFFVLPFHNGALLLFIVYFIRYLPISKNKLLILNIIFIPLTILTELNINPLQHLDVFIDIFSNESMRTKANSYLNNNDGLSIFHTAEYILLMYFVYKNYSEIISNNKYGEFIIKIFIVLLPIMTVFRSSIFLRREIDYFIPTYAILIGYICNIYWRNRILIIIGFSTICYYGYQRFIHLFDGGELIPYKTWLDIQNVHFFN